MSWSKVKMGEFLINRESRFKPKDKAIAGLKRIDKIDFSGTIYLSDKPSNTDMIIVKKGDLVISGINVEKGAMSVYQGKEDVTATIHYSSYSFDEKKIDIEFLKMFLKSPEFKIALKEQVPGGIKTEIKPKHLLPLEVNIPTQISDQKEIVKRFTGIRKLSSSVDTEIINQQDLLTQLRQSFLREAMQGKLVKQDPKDGHAKDLLEKIKAEKAKSGRKEKEFPPIKPEEIPFEIPENWVWCRFSDVVLVESNLVSPFDFPNHPHVAPDNIEKNTGKLLAYKTVKEDDVRSANHYFYAGQLVYSKVRPKLNKVVLVDFEGLCSADMYPLRSLIDPSFLKFCMLSEFFLTEVDRFDNRVKMPKINQNQLSQIPIILPPLAEQIRIVEKLTELLNLCDLLQASIQASQQQNELLLQQVLKEALMN